MCGSWGPHDRVAMTLKWEHGHRTCTKSRPSILSHSNPSVQCHQIVCIRLGGLAWDKMSNRSHFLTDENPRISTLRTDYNACCAIVREQIDDFDPRSMSLKPETVHDYCSGRCTTFTKRSRLPKSTPLRFVVGHFFSIKAMHFLAINDKCATYSSIITTICRNWLREYGLSWSAEVDGDCTVAIDNHRWMTLDEIVRFYTARSWAVQNGYLLDKITFTYMMAGFAVFGIVGGVLLLMVLHSEHCYVCAVVGLMERTFL